MVATAQRFHELHPHVEIHWRRHSLQAFAHEPLDRLADQFDLLVIDHPCVGFAAKSGSLLDLSSLISSETLQKQEQESVGQSHWSYQFEGGQWALAMDAAAPVSASRPDLLEHYGGAPATWKELISLGRKGVVACPSIPLDVYGNFLNLCTSLGGLLFPGVDHITDELIAVTALEMLRELAEVIPTQCFQLNPIRTLEIMSQADLWAYCPFIYGYSNYARPGYAPHLLHFGEIVTIAPGVTPMTMLGGTGLALSANCSNPLTALAYALFVTSAETQRGLYFQSGGQPASHSAWLDAQVNRASTGFFVETLPILERAFVRPRYNGYLDFQDGAGRLIHAYLREGGVAAVVFRELTELYRDSLEHL